MTIRDARPQAELDWLLDDAVAVYDGATCTSGRMSKWRDMKAAQREGQALETAMLRLPMDALTRLWHRRINERCFRVLHHAAELHCNEHMHDAGRGVSGCPSNT